MLKKLALLFILAIFSVAPINAQRNFSTPKGEVSCETAFNVLAGSVVNPATTTGAIQACLNLTGDVSITTPGTYQINSTLVISSNTKLRLGSGVVIQQASGTNLQMLVNNAYNTNATTFSISSLTWVSGVSVTAACAAVCNPTVGGYVWIQGASPSMYNGVFKINASADNQHFVFNVFRQPNTTASGTIVGKYADTNITLEGGTWDYNSANNSSASGQQADAIILGVVQGVAVRNVTMQNGKKFLLEVAAARDVTVDNMTVPATGSDLVKLYGPLQRVRVQHVHGSSSDDGISVQTKEAAAFASQMWTFGDVNDVLVDGVDVESTSATAQVAIYPSVNEFMSGIVVRNVSGNGVYPVAVSPSYAASVLNDLKLENITANGTGFLLGAGAFTGTITNLDIRNYSWNPNGTSNNAINLVASNTVNKLTVDGLISNAAAGDTSAVYLIVINGTVDELTARNCVVRYNQRFINFSATSTFTRANFSNITQTVGDNFIVISAGAAGQEKVSITDSQIKTTAVFNTSASASLLSSGNVYDSATNGVARITGSITVTMIDGGNNSLINGSVWEVTVSGSPTLTMGSSAYLTFGGHNGLIATSTGQVGALFIPAGPTTLIRFTVFVLTPAATCTVSPVLSIKDFTSTALLSNITITNATATFDSGAISVPMTAGDQIGAAWTTAASGCGTNPSGIEWLAEYR